MGSVAQEVSGHLLEISFSPALGSSSGRASECGRCPRGSRERRHFHVTKQRKKDPASLPLPSFKGYRVPAQAQFPLRFLASSHVSLSSYPSELRKSPRVAGEALG